MRGEQIFKDLISGRVGGPIGDSVRTGLTYLSKAYEKGVEIRNEKYDNPTRVTRMGVPVISIGNITVGGTGKTPMVRYVCDVLHKDHHKVTILSRGYKADSNKQSIVVSSYGDVKVSSFISGDEAWLLAKTLPHTSVIIGAKRCDSAQIAVNQLASDVLVLDDGFQHRALGRDGDVVLIDASQPFGFGHVLPRGLLREPLENLKRANYIVLTKTNQVDEESLEETRQKIREIIPHTPMAETIHHTKGFQTLGEWCSNEGIHSIEAYDQTPLLAVSGIGQPDSFKANLESYGFKIADTMNFGDHHEYTESDVVRIWQHCFKTGIQGIITTEKDAVKLAQVRAIKDLNIPIYVLVIGIEFVAGEDDFVSYILDVAKRK